jgi:peroxin-13
MSSQPMASSFDTLNTGFMPTIEQARTQGAAPPPPPRLVQQQQQQQQQLGLYPPTNYLSPYSYSPYQAGGFYNNYRLTPYGTQGNVPVSNFAQLAMDESRSAFSSIESVIHTFRSISLMLESTFTSVYSSFRTVTDVFDHFTRLRSEITTLYPLVLIWRFLKYLYHRLLRFLHIRQSTSGNTEETWSAIYNSLQQTTTNTNGQSTSSSLLVAFFFIVSFGTPILMLKFLNSIIKKRQANNNWIEQETNQARVIALYDYVARNSDELSFTRGTTIYLAPISLQSTTSHWFLGTIDRIHTGLIPANYVQPVRQPPNSSITLHPQTPLNATSAAPPPPPSQSSPITNIPQSTSHGQEQPTLS